MDTIPSKFMNKIILNYWKQYLLNLTPILRKVLGHKIPANEKVDNNSNKNARHGIQEMEIQVCGKPMLIAEQVAQRAIGLD